MTKTILVTGASSGLGRDTAETLAKAGHKVFASVRDPTGRNKDAANALLAQSIAIVELDVTDDASVEAAVARVPHDVAEAVAALIALPRGSRPARPVVGQAFGADVVNAATAPVQHGAVEALGLGALASIAV